MLPTPPRLAALALAMLLPACVPAAKYPFIRLVDQGTFRGPPVAPTAADLARARLPPLPLVTIRFDRPDFDSTPALLAAIEQAQARKPDAAFDVLTPVPATADQATQNRYTQQGAIDAQAVATALAAAGVDPERVHIGLRGDPGTPPREVRVYVR